MMVLSISKGHQLNDLNFIVVGIIKKYLYKCVGTQMSIDVEHRNKMRYYAQYLLQMPPP